MKIMKLTNFHKVFALAALFTLSVLIMACPGNQGANNGSNSSAPTSGASGEVVDAYKKLFEAVKSKDTERIRQVMSKNSLELANFQSSRTNKPIEEVLKNGFTATTFAESMPEIRDERIKDNFGAVEVWNGQDKRWEDVPFIKEDGAWKLAIGDLFRGTYVKPGENQSTKEQIEANTKTNNLVPANVPSNVNPTTNKATNMNANVNTVMVQPIVPKRDERGQDNTQKK